jgi:hypothetical protein
MKSADGTVPLPNQFQAGEAMEKAQAWESRAEAAKRGVFQCDNMAQRDSTFTADAAIKALQQRAAAIGLVEYENPLRTTGDRF